MNNNTKFVTSLVTAAILAGCGADSTINVKEEPLPAIQGVFVDSPVSGLGYRSDSVTDGVTNDSGQFNYFRGEAITFFIGDIEFPSVAAANIITPMEVFSTDTTFHPAVINTLRLLQSLDNDGDPTNGISISPNAANVAELTLAEGETATDFFSRSADDFAAAVNTWLPNAGGSDTLVSSEQAILHFVDFLYAEYNNTQPNAFDTSNFSGEVYNPLVKSGKASLENLTFTPDDEDNNQAGSFTQQNGDGEVVNGRYEFMFGNRVLAMTTGEGDTSQTQYLISRSYNTVSDAYSICTTDSTSGLASLVLTCDNNEDAKNNIIVFSQTQADIELEKLEALADQESLALSEAFDTSIETFFTSSYKKLSDEQGAGPLYYKTGGTPAIDESVGQMTLAGARFSIGNTVPGIDTSSSNTAGVGIYNISEGFTISFDVISHNGAGSLSLYVDNNTTSQGNSVHGAASKFYGKSLSEENNPAGQRFSYTYVPGEDVVTGADLTAADARGVLNSDIKNSFFQLRTDSAAHIVIDNLTIETVATEVPDIEPPVDEPPTSGVTFAEEDFNTTEDFFSTTYKSLPTDGTIPLYTRTGGSVVLEDNQLKLDSGRFTWGNSTPAVDTSGDDTVTTGVFDLSKPYNIVVDIISADEPTDDKDNSFIIYVDNNTSSSSKSIHGGSSKFFSRKIADLVDGETLTIPGYVASATSFLQLRTESGGVVVIDNLRIEYLDQASGYSCDDASDLYFCDDFSSGTLDNWNILSKPENTSGAVGQFDVLTLEDGNKVMRYTAGGEGGEIILAKDDVMANVPSNNYYIEADIRPRQNSTTRNKQLYLMGRYEGEGNWFAGGLNLQNSSSSTQVEVAVTTNGSIARPVQKKSPLLLGEKGGTEDGVWYTTRFEMIDDALTVYLNGEKMGTVTDTTYSLKGLIGIFTNNRSFELDNLKIGDPSVKPIQLTLDYKEPNWATTTSSDALVINVSAFQDDGETADSFTVSSSDESVVSASIDGNIVTIQPTGSGSATITFVSGSDANIVRTIEVNVEPGFEMPTTQYGSLSGKLSPAISSTEQYVDTQLSITFDNEPSLGTLGEVHIYNASDDSLVDTIKVGTNANVLGYTGQDSNREVNYTPISLDGNTLHISPRNNVLAYGQSYYVVIGDDVVTGAELNGTPFDGLGANSSWSFTTKFAAPTGSDVLVDDDGAADFRTVQGALNYVMENIAKDDPAVISIKDGVYHELLYLRNKNNLTIQGESRENTVVHYDNYESFNGGSSGRPVFLVEGADMLVLNNFTLKNSHIRNASVSNQAEAIYFNSSHRLVANNMNFISEQDTILVKGYTWFYNTLVAGNVDFIWGYPVAALFESSEIRTIGDSKNGASDTPVSGGYVLQARVPNENDPGFVFLNSDFTHGPGPLGNTVAEGSTYIARSGGSSSYYDNIVLINNTFDSHIADIGWASQGVNSQPASNPEVASLLSGWREFGSMDMAGNALDLSTRVGGYELTAEEASNYQTRAAIFASYNNDAGWTPEPLEIPTLPEPPKAISPVVKDLGFAGYNFDVTGGEGGDVVTVTNGVDLIDALDSAKDSNTPVTIYVDGTITDANSGGSGDSINIKDMDNVSIIGVTDRGEFSGIGINIRRANNIIIQNLTIHEVLTGGKDGISIEGDDDGSTTSNIWIDHNEIYADLSVDKDFYDGLLDSKSGAENITISYNYLHDGQKTSLHGHSDDDSNPNKNRNITFHHNRFENLTSRVPLFRFGYGHLFNNYFNNISSTAINSRMGAELLIENNVFENTKNPIVSFYSAENGYWNLSGNYFGEGVTWTTPDAGDVSAQDGVSTSSYVVPYSYSLDPVDEVKAKVLANAGVNKIDQSNLDIPIADDSGEVEPPVQEAIGLPFNENFSATNAEEFFSNSYRDLSGTAGSGTPLFHRVTGSVEVSSGELTMTGARISIGNTAPEVSTTAEDTTTTGVFDLTNNYQVSFTVVAIAGNTDKNFQLYVDNNTSSSSKSINGGASKFYSIALKDLTPGQRYVVDGLVASASSFITIRTESDATITIDDLTIE